MRIKSLSHAAVAVFVLLFATLVFAQVPRTISYQGLITDPSGTIIADGNHSLTVSLYTSGGTLVHTETQTVPVIKGVFNFIIGVGTGIPGSVSFNEPYLLGLAVDGGAELSPRTPLTSAPYALRAAVADGLSSSATGVVTSVNGQGGAITLEGGGGTTITNVGNTFTISSSGGGGTGIQGVQNLDGSLAITSPNGPTATISVGPLGITNDKLQNASVTASKISSLGGTAGQVLTADGSGNASWTTLSLAGGLTLPFTGSMAGATSLFSITNSGLGGAGLFVNSNTAATSSALVGTSNHASPTTLVAGVEGRSTNGFGIIGSGGAGSSGIYGTVITTPTAGAFFGSTGVSGFSDAGSGVGGTTYHSNANSSGVRGSATGAGNGVHGASTAGRAGFFEITTASNTSHALEARTNGSGVGVYSQQTASSGAAATAMLGEVSSTTGGTASAGVSGVIGRVTPTSPGAYSAGVRGINNGTSGNGIGVVGIQAGSGWGVYGETPSGYGVYGYVSGTSVANVGVRGETASPSGVAVEARYSGTGLGTALELDNGAIKVAGTNKAAFVHTATVANKISANGTDIDNAMCNGDPNAILIVTQKLNPSGIVYNNSPIGVYYSTARSKWEIFNENSAAIPTNAQFNVLVIKQ